MKIEDLHKKLPNYMPVALGDKMQYFLGNRSDQQLRFIIKFNNLIDFKLFKKALRSAMYEIPVFSYSYIDTGKKAFWKKQEIIDMDNIIDFIEVNQSYTKEFSKFKCLTISSESYPLIKARIIRCQGKDTICIHVHHSLTDGAGLKIFVNKIAANYCQLLQNINYVPRKSKKTIRDYSLLNNHFSILQRIHFIKKGLKKTKQIKIWNFIWPDSKDTNAHFLTFEVHSDDLKKITTYCKHYKSTINDLVLAAFYRAFVAANNIPDNVEKPIVVPVDLRKYLNPRENSVVGNITSSIICNIGMDIGDSLSDTLVKVRNEMTKRKNKHTELYMLFHLMLFSKLKSYSTLKNMATNQKIAIPLISNFGVIESSKIKFGDTPIERAYISGPISYNDYFSLMFSTFNNNITFSIGFRGDNDQVKNVKYLLELFAEEIKSCCNIGSNE